MKWIPTLFAAEAIPSAMITFVALLMFVQLGEGWGMSTLLCGLLTLPWVLKSFVREKVRRYGHFHKVIKLVEMAIAIVLMLLAFCIVFRRAGTWSIFGVLMLLGLFCAWHELLARMYYERMLRPRQQRYFNSVKMSLSQACTVVTYGLMLMVVGTLEVLYHNRPMAISLSWSKAIYLLAGLYLLLVLYNLFILPPPFEGRVVPKDTLGAAMRAEMRVIDRILHKPYWLLVLAVLFFMLLPQSLMFHTRVLFLLAPVADGGLGCSLQWIALAQGTVGVIAFSIGLGFGHWAERHYALFTKVPGAHLLLILSPFVYYAMTQWPPQNLLMLCVATFVAQGTFGLGLNACVPYVRYFSGERYRSTINYLYIPVIALVMLLPVSFSGWMLEQMNFSTFFALDAMLAVAAIVSGYIGWHYVLRKEIQ